MQEIVSIIVVNYFTSVLVKRLIKNIRSNGSSEKTRIIIVDNSDDDEEQRKLENLADAITEICIADNNVGFGRACNIAYKKTKSKYVLLLNPDAYLLEGALGELLNTMEENSDIAAVSPVIYWDDEKHVYLPPTRRVTPLSVFKSKLANITNTTEKFLSYQNRREAIKVLRSNKIIDQESLSGGVALLRRKAVDEAGGLFDERFFMYFEDTDLFTRLTRKRFRLVINPKAEAVHNYSQSGNKDENIKSGYMADSYRLFMDKYAPYAIYRWCIKILDKIAIARKADNGEIVEMHEPRSSLKLSPKIKDGWVMEISPSRNMIPSAIYFGKGEEAILPEGLIKWLKPGKYFLRLGGENKYIPSFSAAFEIK